MGFYQFLDAIVVAVPAIVPTVAREPAAPAVALKPAKTRFDCRLKSLIFLKSFLKVLKIITKDLVFGFLI